MDLRSSGELIAPLVTAWAGSFRSESNYPYFHSNVVAMVIAKIARGPTHAHVLESDDSTIVCADSGRGPLDGLLIAGVLTTT